MDYFGGGEGNRTPVQKQATPDVYMLRRHCYINMVLRNVQSYTMRASKIRLQMRQSVSIAIKVMIHSKSAYMASAVRAAQVCPVKLTLRMRKLGGNLYCLRLLLVGRLTICPNRHATRNHLLLSKPSQPHIKSTTR